MGRHVEGERRLVNLEADWLLQKGLDWYERQDSRAERPVLVEMSEEFANSRGLQKRITGILEGVREAFEGVKVIPYGSGGSLPGSEGRVSKRKIRIKSSELGKKQGLIIGFGNVEVVEHILSGEKIAVYYPPEDRSSGQFQSKRIWGGDGGLPGYERIDLQEGIGGMAAEAVDNNLRRMAKIDVIVGPGYTRTFLARYRRENGQEIMVTMSNLTLSPREMLSEEPGLREDERRKRFGNFCLDIFELLGKLNREAFYHWDLNHLYRGGMANIEYDTVTGKPIIGGNWAPIDVDIDKMTPRQRKFANMLEFSGAWAGMIEEAHRSGLWKGEDFKVFARQLFAEGIEKYGFEKSNIDQVLALNIGKGTLSHTDWLGEERLSFQENERIMHVLGGVDNTGIPQADVKENLLQNFRI